MASPQKHLNPNRFRRIWGIAQTIADQPGLTRAELSRRFNLSERQVQADLNIMRSEMLMPLVRSVGYRFVDEAGSTISAAMTFEDVLLLCQVMVKARGDRSIPAAPLATLIEKTTRLAPPHLRHLAARLLDPMTRPIHAPLCNAILSGGSVLLTWRDQWGTWDAKVQPELLFPYLRSWYVLGTVKVSGVQTRDRMVPLEQVVTAEPIHEERKTRGAA